MEQDLLTYVNIQAGLLYRAPKILRGGELTVVGKKMDIEVCEMDVLIINGSYYTIVGWYGTLAIVEKLGDDSDEE